MNWEDMSERFFTPLISNRSLALPGGQRVVVIDDVLIDPSGLVDWCTRQEFHAPAGYPYPGLVAPGPKGLSARMVDLFAQYARTALQARRTLDHTLRMSMVTTRPEDLDPIQWQCHRDRVSSDPSILYIAYVLYLFRDPALGGTSFYVPRQAMDATDRLQHDCQTLSRQEIAARYGLAAGYMGGSNPYFDCVLRIPAAWNRMILYDAGFFHSGDIGRPEQLSADPNAGRLTANGFFVCRRRT